MNRTTNIQELKNFAQFTWGKILKIEDIGPYTIATFCPWKRDGSTVCTGDPDHAEINYHVWVDGKDCHESFESLDAALAGCIAYKLEGPNHRADKYFIRSMFD
jgi:hypothetical protein